MSRQIHRLLVVRIKHEVYVARYSNRLDVHDTRFVFRNIGYSEYRPIITTGKNTNRNKLVKYL